MKRRWCSPSLLGLVACSVSAAVVQDDALQDAFFNVAKYPTVTYKSDSMTFKDGASVVNGQLTLLGGTQSVPFRIENRSSAKCIPFSSAKSAA